MQTAKDGVWVGWLVDAIYKEAVPFQRVRFPISTFYLLSHPESVCKNPIR